MKSTKFNPNSVTNTINKVNSILGQQKLQSPSSSQTDLAPKSDSMQMVACPECHLEFPGIDLLQAHISVSHKHLDVKLPSSVGGAASAAASQDNEGSNGGNDGGPAAAAAGRPSWHAALEDSQEPFKCSICGKGFQKTSKLTAHMKIHRYATTTITQCSVSFYMKKS